MIRRRLFELNAIVLLTLLMTFGAACGGGGGGGGNVSPPGPLTAGFIPQIAAPGAKTVSLGNPVVNSDLVTVSVLVTDFADFFGAAFTLNYDATRFTYISNSNSNSFLKEAGVTTLYNVVNNPGGELIVSATRQNQGTFVPGVNVVGSMELLTLTVRATSATAGSGVTVSNNNVEICDDANNTCSTAAGVTWGAGNLSAN